MSNVKGWSTGEIGNPFPDHSERGNPNTKGLVVDRNTGELTVPGIEGYIEEDIVDAKHDNRPLKNLVYNDITLENNLIDVASEVDYGVFKNKLNEFDIQVLPADLYPNPDNPEENILITPLRIRSGSSIINGNVTQVGQQKVSYFIRDDNTYLFPPYSTEEEDFVIEIVDQDYYGDYKVVWSSEPQGLPSNFTDFQIEITNEYSNGDPDRQLIFSTYRDWEDIVPYQYHNEDVTNEDLLFGYDTNFGQFSEGYWLNSGNTEGTNVDKLTVKKDILVADKKLSNIQLNTVTGKYEQEIITDSIFFDNIKWQPIADIDSSYIEDVYVHSTGDVYFISSSDNMAINRRLFKRDSILDNLGFKNLTLTSPTARLTGLRQIDGILFILGEEGFITTFDLSQTINGGVNPVTGISTIETIKDVYVWDNKVWIAGEKTLWHTPYESFTYNSVFTELPIETILSDISEEPVIDSINKIIQIRGNSLIDSSLQNQIDNLILNPSFETGGVGNIPHNWNIWSDGDQNATFRIQTGGYVGGFRAVLQLTPTESLGYAWQELEIGNLKIGDKYTLSAYLSSALPNSDEIRLIELDENDSPLSSSIVNYTATTGWNRVILTHTISGNGVKKLRIEIAISSQNALRVDAVQLEKGEVANQFVEMFDYLFIAFNKAATNTIDPPFALLDVKDKYNPKFYRAKYGNIKSINDVIYKGLNTVLFADDVNLYSATFLNNAYEYDRVTITNLSKEYSSLDFRNRLDRINSLIEFGDRVFIGGTVSNKVVKIAASNTDDISINIYESNSGQSIIKLLGAHSLIRTDGSIPARREFKYTQPLYESVDGQTDLGRYIPGESYTIGVQIENGNIQQIEVEAPNHNAGPWTLQALVNNLNSQISGIFPGALSAIYENSFVLSEGLYSIGKRDITHHLRGDIKKIISIPGSNQNLVFIRGSQIFRSKPDPNVLKRPDGTYPDIIDADYFHNWTLYGDDIKLIEYVNKINIDEISGQPLRFDDDANNRRWIEFPVDPGYQIVPGTLRVKTNATTEVGFSEGLDYVVDYKNNRIIRHNGQNVLINSDLWLGDTEVQPLDWFIHYSDSGAGRFIKTTVNDTFTRFAAEILVDSATNKAIAYQVNVPSSLNVGHTYTASTYVRAYKNQTPVIRLTECDATNVTNLSNGYNSTSVSVDIDESNFGSWVRVSVSHTVTNASSNRLRFEIETSSKDQLWFTNSQLERNPIVTPYMKGTNSSRINPDMHVWIDYTESRVLNPTDDYYFDTENRKVVLEVVPSEEKSYYFSYKYERIFNPHVFSDSLPSFSISYDSRDDYFLYQNQGRIWAINQFFSMLSLDEENPLVVDYSYHYPRVDLVKIRNRADEFGNFIYIVKGKEHRDNPYKPYDLGTEDASHVLSVTQYDIEDRDNNEIIYSINVTTNDFNRNDIYDRRIWIDSRENSPYNISLTAETVAYFPFSRNFNATNGISPLNYLESSKIVPIIRNFSITQNEEVGSFHDGYQFILRDKVSFPGATTAIIVNPQDGNDLTGTGTSTRPFKTINKALSVSYFTDSNNRKNDIIVENGLVTENVEINKPFSISIWARSYFTWKGALQVRSLTTIQGAYFMNSDVYLLNNINMYYCTFDDSTVNAMITCNAFISNCEFKNCHNSPLRVNDHIFPSPFIHPYKKSFDPSRDDGTPHPTTQGVATSDLESIAPGDSFSPLAVQSSSEFTLFRCLIHDTTDHVVEYDPEPNWPASFIFDKCTIAHNRNLFVTPKLNLDVLYADCILFENGEVRGSDKKQFDSNSNINLQGNFVDFSTNPDDFSSDFNYGTGTINGRPTCVGGEDFNPLFIGPQGDFFNYQLRSTARGFSSDSICLSSASDNSDLGCWDESRRRTDNDIPRNIFTYIAFINEGVKYPIVLNSEKITFTVEFKPTDSLSSPGVMFDTRMHQDETDYIALVYNNNDPDDVSLTQNPSNDPINPYRFRLIVANRDRAYSIVSPLLIQSDADYQQWHNLSWTVDYEQTHNPKSTFDEKDRLQNIVSFFHNKHLSVESYIKYDLNRDVYGNLIDGRNNDLKNDWNFNDISRVITLAGQFDGSQVISGYYSELRIDNRFVDRKILDMWNRKKVPFNDPFTQLNQNMLVKGFDERSLSEFWSLKSKFDKGSKGNRFVEGSSWKYATELGDQSWVLNSPITNILGNNSGFQGVQTSVVSASSLPDIESSGHTFTSDITLTTTGSRNEDDNSGIILSLSSETINSIQQLEDVLDTAFSNLPVYTNISYRFTKNGRLEFFTTDGEATSIQYNIGNQTDSDILGFTGSTTLTGSKNLGSIIIDCPNEPGTLGEFDYYTTNDSRSTRLTDNSLVLERKNLIIQDPFRVYHSLNIGPHTFVYSAYIHYTEGQLTNDLIRFYHDTGSSPQYQVWTKIEKVEGDWWLVSKTFSNPGGTTRVGIAFAPAVTGSENTQRGRITIDALQLEQRSYESPYVHTSNLNQDSLIVNKNLFGRDKGNVFFRLYPRFDFYDTRERVLFEMAGKDSELEEINTEESFKILYYFSEERNRGIFSFRICDPLGETTSKTWTVETVEDIFYNWHSVGFNYDFSNQRFVMWFDYFRHTIDAIIDRFDFFTDGVFGRDTRQLVDSSDIAIKDIIINTQPISDTDIMSWVSTYEFYKESLILNTLEEYNDDITKLITQVSGLDFDTINILNRMDLLESDISVVQSQMSSINGQMVGVNSILSNHDSRITTNTNNIIQINSITGQLQTQNTFVVDGNTSRWNQSLAQTQQYNVYDNRDDINDLFDQVSTEVSDRIVGDQQIRLDIASNVATFGASLIGVQGITPPGPLDAQFTQTTVEGVLRELAGSGRTLENVRDNADQIVVINSSISGMTLQIDDMQDGTTGSWNSTIAKNNRYNIYENRIDINSNRSDIIQLQDDLGQEIIDRTQGDTEIRNDLSSTAFTKGASLIGINDFSNRYMAVTVEAALDEVKIHAEQNQLRIEDNENDILLHTTDIQSLYEVVGLLADGADGSNWEVDFNLVAHENRIQTLETNYPLLEGRVSNNESDIDQLQIDLSEEAILRSDADMTIVNALASTNINQGASLIGIYDEDNVFTSQNVEGALNELYNITVGGINWKSPVELWTDLPEIGNVVGDTLIVNNAIDDPNETTAVRAQYIVVSTTGARQEQWTKVQNIDREDAASIGYDNTVTGLLAENVQSAIDELSERSVDPTKHDVSVQSSDWTVSGDDYYVDIVHDLGTQDVVVLAMDSSTGEIIGVDEIERLDNNVVRIHQSENISVEFTVFGVVNSYSTIVSNWIPSSGMYYSDVKHNFDTKKLMTSVFNTVTGERIGVDKLTFIDNNTLRITVDDNSLSLNVFVLKSASMTKSKDLSNWSLAGTEFSSSIEIDTGYDAVYHFFDTTTSKSIEVNNITLSGNTLTIKKSDSNHVRMIILK